MILLWFGYTLVFHRKNFLWGSAASCDRNNDVGDTSINGENLRTDKNVPDGSRAGTQGKIPGSQLCPVCSSLLENGEQASAMAFPSLNGSSDRLMHIRGCRRCISGKKQRICPVCGGTLVGDEILICRLFDRRRKRQHVHVLGCSQCHRLGSARR